MKAPKCTVCGKREWNHTCAGSESLSNLPAGPEVSSKPGTGVLLTAEDEKKMKLVEEPDICPACGTNLKTRRKERERRREWMSRKRAEEKADE